MKRWHLVIDVAKCENCNNCFLACKDEHCGNDWPGYAKSQPLRGQRWMNILRKERGTFPAIDVAYLPKPCMHCDDAPCIKAARNGAAYKRDDGIVIIDPKKARNQQHLVAACPYGAIWWNEEEQLPQKCTLCAHLLDSGWKAPRCVQACPTGALTIHREEAGVLEEARERRRWSVLGKKDNPTRPLVFYENLHRFSRCFIAGSVATRQNDVEDCSADIEVRLLKDGIVIRQTATNAFGDFRFDDLAPDSGAYTIGICDDDAVVHVDVTLGNSLSIGTVWI